MIGGAQNPSSLLKVEEFAAALPNSQLAVFEKSGHYPSVQEPEAFLSTVLEFLGVVRGEVGED